MGPIPIRHVERSDVPHVQRAQADVHKPMIPTLQQLCARQTALVLCAPLGPDALRGLDAFELQLPVHHSVDASWTAGEFRAALNAKVLGQSTSTAQFAWRIEMAVAHIKQQVFVEPQGRYRALLDLLKLVQRATIHAIMRTHRRAALGDPAAKATDRAKYQALEQMLRRELNAAFGLGPCLQTGSQDIKRER